MEITSEIKKDSYAVKITASENGKVVGWVYLYLIFQDRHDEPYGLVENLYVESDFRSRGIGKELIETLIKEAKNRQCYKLIATSRIGKGDVHSWYERLGFKNHGFEFRMDLRKSKPKQKD